MEIIILAGGLGTRLRSEVNDVPKPMAPVGEKPFLAVILNHLSKFRITRIVISIGYLGHQISSYFGGSYKGIEIVYSTESEPLGTGGAIKKALAYLTEEQAVVVNGDTFIDLDFDKMFDKYLHDKPKMMMVLKSVDDCGRYGAVKMGTHNNVEEFERNRSGVGLINAGVYVVRTDIYDKNIPGVKFSFEEFVEMNLSELQVPAYISEGYFIDMGIPSDYKVAIEKFS